MIVPPDKFSKVQRKFLFSYSTFRYEFSFEKSPESLQTIDMISFSVDVLSFTVIDETMNVPSRSNTGIRFPSIRTDGGSG
jgi:hypothetical protein